MTLTLEKTLDETSLTESPLTTHETGGSSAYSPQRFFEPVGFEQARQIIHRLHKEMTPILKVDFFKLIAFRKAKEALDWNVPAGTYAFNLIDLRLVFRQSVDFDERFDCFFLTTKSGHSYHAWLHKNDEGIVRYYMQHPFEAETRYMMDVVDLYGFMFGGYAVADYDKERYKRHISFELVREQQSLMPDEKMVGELDRLNELESQVNMRWNRRAVGHTDATLLAVLKELLAEAKKRTFVEGHYDARGRTVFFLSASELVRRMKEQYGDEATVKKSKATLNNAMNLLVGLGFVTKLDGDALHAIDPDLEDNRNIHARGGKNPVSYYVLNDLPTMYWIRKQVKKMDKKNLRLHNVTQRRFERAFGRELRKQTFNHAFLKTKTHELKSEKEAYTQAFYWHLKQEGFVTKEDLADIIPSRNVSDKLWTDLVSETRGYYVKRTTKAVREVLDIATTGAVFVATRTLHPFEPIAEGTLTAEDIVECVTEEAYNELVDSALFWFGSLHPSFEISSSYWDEPTDTTPAHLKEDTTVMAKEHVDKRADVRFEEDARIEIEETVEFETTSETPRDEDVNYDNLDSQLRQPQTPEEEEKIKRAEALLRGWGV